MERGSRVLLNSTEQPNCRTLCIPFGGGLYLNSKETAGSPPLPRGSHLGMAKAVARGEQQ
jgi:hypothetical protein